ncbi:MAG: hypothetical protein NTY77_14100 [Elusimicrobia bacterium]|nr:hypothetical protein [Elusimicrobiota bacterium]
MKKITAKRKTVKRTKAGGGGKTGEDTPLEFDRGWQELEAQYDRQKMDFSSLAAQLGVDTKDKTEPLEP